MRRAFPTLVAAILIALPIAAGAVTRINGVFPTGGPIDLPRSYISEVDFNVDDSAVPMPPVAYVRDSRRSGTSFGLASLNPESAPAPLPVSALMIFAAFAGLAFLSHRRVCALS